MNIWQIYQINSEIQRFLEDHVDAETGEILDFEGLEQLNLKRDEIIEGLMLTVKNCRAEAEAVKAEKLALAERQSKLEKNVEKLKQFLADELRGKPFKTAKVECSFRKSESTDIIDLGLIPAEYLDYTPSAKKKEIKAAIKAGGNVPGAKIVEKLSITIK